MEYSTTQANNIGAFVGVAVILLGKFGFDVKAEELTTIIGAIISIWSIVANWIHRHKKGDLTLGGFRK